jgi:putative RecB family exonuclease
MSNTLAQPTARAASGTDLPPAAPVRAREQALADPPAADLATVDLPAAGMPHPATAEAQQAASAEAEQEATPEPAADAEPEEETGPSLSPSRAADFMTCPLLYRFRVIDHLPEAPSPAAARGTLVHAVLERLFDEPAGGRTPAAARALLTPQWERLAEEDPRLAELFAEEAERQAWLDEAASMLDRYFTLEDPTRIEPTHRELSVRALLDSGLRLRGYIDRLDVARTGEVRIVDYKTGTAPREEYEARALFQMKFYAVVLWRTSGSVPRLLQLIYLGNGEIVRYAPDEADLLATERKINALWQAIDRARTSGDWRPHQSRICEWCSYQAFCPEFGGTPPPLPDLSAQPVSTQPDLATPPDLATQPDLSAASLPDVGSSPMQAADVA